jgi:hypothetical protein
MERYNLVDVLRDEMLQQLPQEERTKENVEEGIVDPGSRELLLFCGKIMQSAIARTLQTLIINEKDHAIPHRTLIEIKKAIRKSIYFKLPPVEDE